MGVELMAKKKGKKEKKVPKTAKIAPNEENENKENKVADSQISLNSTNKKSDTTKPKKISKKEKRDLKIQFEFQEKAIKNLRDGINHLEVQNAELYETADSKLAKLDEFLSKLRQMHQDLQAIKDNSEYMETTFADIREKLGTTSTKISESMTRLNQLVDNKKESGQAEVIRKDIDLVETEVYNHKQELIKEVEQSEKTINEEIEILDKKLNDALLKAKKEATACCCTIL